MAVISSSGQQPGISAQLRMMLGGLYTNLEVILSQDIFHQANELLIRRRMASGFGALARQNTEPPLELRCTLFHSTVDFKEFTHLPIRLSLPDWGASYFYIHANQTWWNDRLEHVHQDRVPSSYRALLLIL